MTSCLFLLWMAQNIVLYLFSFKFSLIKKKLQSIMELQREFIGLENSELAKLLCLLDVLTVQK